MEPTSDIQITQLEDEMKRSYLDYAMSVIVGRALPDIRDGLKPVHRRVLFAMHEMKNDWNKPYKKSARITGDVIGKYHPHGDTAVYDTIVRMAQDFSLRYPLIDGQGNFGSVDGDSAAAMRYTEIRLSRLAHELLADIEKDTVDHGPNYDESLEQPLVLPTRIPNLLVNGSAGIAVGMATNIPPHNMSEVVKAALGVIQNPDMSLDELMEIVPGPDFPTHGIIHGARGIREAYETGRGRIHIRARTEFEQDGNAQRIIVSELPYQVNKARLIEKIADLVKNKKIEGISGLRDESDKRGMRVVIEIKRGGNADVLLNQLFSQTQLEVSFGINMVALNNNIPRIFNLREMLDEFIAHRRDVVTRRSIFELRKARDRAHILEGLAVALGNIDEIIELIRASQTPAIAKAGLVERSWDPAAVLPMLEKSDPQRTRPDGLGEEFGLVGERYHLSEVQAQAILDLRLHRLTGLEKDKIHQEYIDIMAQIDALLLILMSPARLMEVISEELQEVLDKYGDERRTEIIAARFDIDDEDLIKPEEMVVTLSHLGYAKAQPLEEYRAQRRGGRGKMATTTRDEDFVSKLFVANTHDHVLCFTSLGRLYWLKVYRFPTGGRSSRGRPLVNLLQLDEGERVTSMMPIKSFDEGWYVFMATRQGVVKKTDLMDFSRPRANGVKAVELNDDDELVGTALTNGCCDVLLFSAGGRAIRFSENTVRAMGRVARGVRGMNLADDDVIISLVVVDENATEGSVLTASAKGIGKRTAIGDWPRKGRAGKGVIAMNLPDEGDVQLVSAQFVNESDQIMMITDGGTLIRSNVSEVSVLGRITRGVKLINLGKKEDLVSVERIDESQIGDDDESVDDLGNNAGEKSEASTTESIGGAQDGGAEGERGHTAEVSVPDKASGKTNVEDDS